MAAHVSSTSQDAFARGFLEFVNASPSPFHAVDTIKKTLVQHGFEEISEKNEEQWSFLPKGKYFFTRNQSTIIAFAVGGAYRPGEGFSIIAAHTDSPCPKLKPLSHRVKQGFHSAGVELYGGGLWHTWFDRDLSIAGRVIVAEGDKFISKLVRINKPIMRIPHIAIHLAREISSDGFKPNNENHVVPMLATSIKAALFKPVNNSEEKIDNTALSPVLLHMIADEIKVSPTAIRDFELCVFDLQPATIGGALDEFIFSARLDNLMMSYCGIQALVASVKDEKSFTSDKNVRMVALFDNEEVGSDSNRGASSNLMISTLRRIHGNHAGFEAAIQKSLLVSADMAHALHPNYGEKHEERHRPQIHQGLTIKHNANQRYATTSVSAFVLREIAKKHNIPLQDFCIRQDSVCGSTIGPILSTNCGIRTVDVGVPQLSMHSVREMCGIDDAFSSLHLFIHFYEDFRKMDDSLIVD